MNAYFKMVACTSLAVAVGAACLSDAHAQGVISEWNQVQAPPAPELHQVTADPTKTALLLMDFGQNCSREPRCMADIPHIKMLLDQARSHRAFVLYSSFAGLSVISELAPQAGEPTVLGFGDRFYNTNLDQTLKQHGIDTIIACGTVANGVEFFTAAGATARGYHVIVPVDCMPAGSAYAEQNVVWGLANDPEFTPPRAPRGRQAGDQAAAAARTRGAARGSGAGRPSGPLRGYATLTSVDMIHFG
ncbi:MAG TPA: isochorismatase family protein [Steroidobacteraceae bacterium]|jgi:nicotinamidase-related amidase|nr:isochorismatase family protein [Steroidobacteraceae bacterium]